VRARRRGRPSARRSGAPPNDGRGGDRADDRLSRRAARARRASTITRRGREALPDGSSVESTSMASVRWKIAECHGCAHPLRRWRGLSLSSQRWKKRRGRMVRVQQDNESAISPDPSKHGMANSGLRRTRLPVAANHRMENAMAEVKTPGRRLKELIHAPERLRVQAQLHGFTARLLERSGYQAGFVSGALSRSNRDRPDANTTPKVLATVAAVLLSCAGAAAAAADYPTKPVRLVVVYPPGG